MTQFQQTSAILFFGIMLGVALFFAFPNEIEVIQEVQVIVEKEVEVTIIKEVQSEETFYNGFMQGCMTGLFYMELQITGEVSDEEILNAEFSCNNVLNSAKEQGMFEHYIIPEEEQVNG